MCEFPVLKVIVAVPIINNIILRKKGKNMTWKYIEYQNIIFIYLLSHLLKKILN